MSTFNVQTVRHDNNKDNRLAASMHEMINYCTQGRLQVQVLHKTPASLHRVSWRIGVGVFFSSFFCFFKSLALQKKNPHSCYKIDSPLHECALCYACHTVQNDAWRPSQTWTDDEMMSLELMQTLHTWRLWFRTAAETTSQTQFKFLTLACCSKFILRSFWTFQMCRLA